MEVFKRDPEHEGNLNFLLGAGYDNLGCVNLKQW